MKFADKKIVPLAYREEVARKGGGTKKGSSLYFERSKGGLMSSSVRSGAGLE